MTHYWKAIGLIESIDHVKCTWRMSMKVDSFALVFEICRKCLEIAFLVAEGVVKLDITLTDFVWLRQSFAKVNKVVDPIKVIDSPKENNAPVSVVDFRQCKEVARIRVDIVRSYWLSR